LRRSLNADATSAELRNIGLSQQANGTLVVDNNVFESAFRGEPEAVRNVLSRIGLQVSQTAASQLADGGNIGRAVNALGDRVRSLEARQAEQQAIATTGQQNISNQTNRFTAGLNSGAAAYERIFST
jgi:flagellar capping protein FliD